MSSTGFQVNLRVFTATIDVSASTTISDTIDLEGCTLVGFITPAALTGTAFTFNVGITHGATLRSLYGKDGTQYSATVAASRFVYVAPADWAGVRFVQIVSGSAEDADRSITLIARPVVL